ncbi:DUF421 domain-containing protein [Amaricoccus solimangrovi]|uniref:DUF421 domain-containing protein n=1 Tax=Amaricoccus solimangrovi TaxID=2589815 RepID=A0A501WW69_9RHOB|nr:YetF domain-containing protein [Amaricoccus solimangrovi]TPE53688.1 DUF421 domain-containing protein [Amaricoccus solimangrovi]
MFFDGWYDLLRLVVVGALAYAGLILFLRTTGKRTLSKMNAFDLVVTVSLGSTLASAILSSDVSLSEALLAFALLCGLQYGVAALSLRSRRFRDLVKSEPSLLFYRGAFVDSALRAERITREEILAAMRGAGASAPAEVGAVVLETDGSLSVVTGTADGPIESLRHVRGAGA